jgi:hypothetical protein
MIATHERGAAETSIQSVLRVEMSGLVARFLWPLIRFSRDGFWDRKTRDSKTDVMGYPRIVSTDLDVYWLLATFGEASRIEEPKRAVGAGSQRSFVREPARPVITRKPCHIRQHWSMFRRWSGVRA